MEELNAVRVEPLGLDRRRNKYWRFHSEGEPSAGAGRIFVEAADGGCFRLLGKVGPPPRARDLASCDVAPRFCLAYGCSGGA